MEVYIRVFAKLTQKVREKLGRLIAGKFGIPKKEKKGKRREGKLGRLIRAVFQNVDDIVVGLIFAVFFIILLMSKMWPIAGKGVEEMKASNLTEIQEAGATVGGLLKEVPVSVKEVIGAIFLGLVILVYILVYKVYKSTA